MGKKNRLIKIVKIVSVGIAIAFGNITLAAAEKASNHNSTNYSATAKNSKTNNQQLLRANVKQNNKHPSSQSVTQKIGQGQSQGQGQGQPLSPQEVSPQIIKPAQEPIPNTEELNPSGNPLSFPTQPVEVEVDLKQPISLEQAIELAVENNREIQQARLAVESDEASLRQARAALFPTFAVNTSLAFGDDAFLDGNLQQSLDDSIADSIAGGLTEEEAIEESEGFFGSIGGSASTSNFDYSGGVVLDYDIFTGGFRGASIRIAKKELATTKLDLEIAFEVVKLETSTNYYNFQNADALVEIQIAAVEDATQTLKDAQLLERAGLGTRFDVLRAEVEVSQAQQTLNTAIADQNIARRQLAETLSLSHDIDISTADAIEEAGVWERQLPETIVLAFKNRAELEQFLLQKEISEEQRTIALSSIRPAVSATAGYTSSDDFEDDFDIADSFNVGISLSWTLFDGGAAQAGARVAEKDAEIAEVSFADQRNLIRFAVEQAFFQLEANRSNIGTATKEVELAEESLRLARLRFQAGVGTQTDVIEAQTQLTTARGTLLTSITDYNLSYASLQREVSNLPDNGLQDLP